MKRRVSLRDHASGRMFGWSSRDKHKERERKPGAGGDVVVVQPSSSPGAKVISGQRYEDTAYPSSGPVPVGKGYGQVYSPSAVNMSRGTTQSAEVAERRGSSASQGQSSDSSVPGSVLIRFLQVGTSIPSFRRTTRFSVPREETTSRLRYPYPNSTRDRHNSQSVSNTHSIPAPPSRRRLRDSRLTPRRQGNWTQTHFNGRSVWPSSTRIRGVPRVQSTSCWSRRVIS